MEYRVNVLQSFEEFQLDGDGINRPGHRNFSPSFHPPTSCLKSFWACILGLQVSVPRSWNVYDQNISYNPPWLLLVLV